MLGSSARPVVVIVCLGAGGLTGCELVAGIDAALLSVGGAGAVGGLDGGGGRGADAASGAADGSGGGRCDNRTLDGNETDVDCGGADCDACTNGFACEGASDCASQFCDVRSGGAGTDGELTCAACLNNDDCTEATPAWHCLAGVCTDTGAKLNGETCSGGDDCLSTHCIDGVCCGTTCDDGAMGDCVACSMAAGAQTDGSCGPIVSGSPCTDETAFCTGIESCDGAGTCLCLEAP